jgi:transcription initiation factor TFIIIB Brf1 subunit/transcription initiation factor TFIIB
MECPDCAGYRFVECESYLTCTSCGLVVQEFWQLVPSYAQKTFADTEEIQTIFNQEDIFVKYQDSLNLTPSMMTTAQEILDQIKSCFKGESRRNAAMSAAIFYASPRTISEISLKVGIPCNIICKAVTEIYDKLQNKNNIVREKYRLIYDAPSSQISATINRLVNTLFFIEDTQSINIKRVVVQLHDQFRGSDIIKPFKEDKLLATYIYMACEKLQIKDGTIKNVAMSCGAAPSTLKTIRAALSKK